MLSITPVTRSKFCTKDGRHESRKDTVTLRNTSKVIKEALRKVENTKRRKIVSKMRILSNLWKSHMTLRLRFMLIKTLTKD